MTLELVNFSKRYGKKIVIDHITLTFEAGKSYALVGVSGSGKTTLLNSIGRLEKIQSGKIRLDGEDIWEISERTFFRDYLGYVFQSYSLLENKTVKQNLKLVETNQTKLVETLEKVGLDATYLAAKIYELSGGQAQRVAIARMLLKAKKIILADEPTGALDKQTGDEIVTLLLNEAKADQYVIIATHDPDVYNQVDVVIDVTTLGDAT
ncbi:ATP-binding cassette domain-containing protein [Lactococcus carnosus]|uniref:ATP-binding cassette domain-containing protein n=1 Tax=Pseudolactococcus carnosus TaxID=2749961 RepID=UPI0008129A93|nr:ATP-binding cassette domain-containing protein [Lactococcus carnosus]SCA92982.1 putative Macrolide export ATP-binding/permease protein MacB type bacteriocin ABC transporter [Lactococcus piscium]MCJ1969905.1 ATP-binding cassette domain-containing protein [Lactococcus carnosus]MCJ1973936.1 ATP-binding cassette domain-containing protein [Lactococcus carnosus]MCJ1976026.1 ATP-binding cassette domain-containing protein [Lactococcus carnosus]MCJ1981851.1 ATP-binding cassette domain-containing pro